jgi:hypothetical protein
VAERFWIVRRTASESSAAPDRISINFVTVGSAGPSLSYETESTTGGFAAAGGKGTARRRTRTRRPAIKIASEI